MPRGWSGVGSPMTANTDVGAALGTHATLSTVYVEPFADVDGQGLPSYGVRKVLQARAVRMTGLATGADGSQIKTSLTLWFPPDQTPLPREQDRVIFEDVAFICVQWSQPQRLTGLVTHHKAMCRVE